MTNWQASSSFLLIYKQYGTTWKQFLRSLLSILGFIVAFAIVFAAVIVVWWFSDGSEVTPSEFLEQNIYESKYGYTIFMVALLLDLIAGIYFAVTKIQKRPFLTLFSIDKSIDWQRLARSYLSWIGSLMFIYLVFAVCQPGRYMWLFSWSEWWPVALVSILLIPMVSISGVFLNSFLLQGFGTLTVSPIRFWIIAGLSNVTLNILPEFYSLTLLSLTSHVFYSFLVVYFLLKDNQLEVFLGIIAANITHLLLITGDPGLPIPSAAIFARINPSPDLLGYLSLPVQYILFYLTYFGLKSDPLSVFKSNNEEVAK